MAQQTPEPPSQRTINAIETQTNTSTESNVNSKNTTYSHNDGLVVLAIVVVFLALIALVVFFVVRMYEDLESQEIENRAMHTATANSALTTATFMAALALTPSATTTPPPTSSPTATPTATNTETPTSTPTPEMAVVVVDQPMARQLIIRRVTVYQPAWVGVFQNENCIFRKGDDEYVGHSQVDPGTTVDVPIRIHEPQFGRIETMLAERNALSLIACLLWREPTETDTSQPIRVRGNPVSATFFVAEAGSSQP